MPLSLPVFPLFTTLYITCCCLAYFAWGTKALLALSMLAVGLILCGAKLLCRLLFVGWFGILCIQLGLILAKIIRIVFCCGSTCSSMSYSSRCCIEGVVYTFLQGHIFRNVLKYVESPSTLVRASLVTSRRLVSVVCKFHCLFSVRIPPF